MAIILLYCRTSLLRHGLYKDSANPYEVVMQNLARKVYACCRFCRTTNRRVTLKSGVKPCGAIVRFRRECRLYLSIFALVATSSNALGSTRECSNKPRRNSRNQSRRIRTRHGVSSSLHSHHSCPHCLVRCRHSDPTSKRGLDKNFIRIILVAVAVLDIFIGCHLDLGAIPHPSSTKATIGAHSCCRALLFAKENRNKRRDCTLYGSPY